MRYVFPVVALVLFACLLWAQEAPDTQVRSEIFKLRVDRVPVLFTALDRKERFVTDLTRSEVEVLDNRKKQEVIGFSRETDLPLRIGMLIDTSNSIRDRFKFEQEAAAEFLTSVVRHKQDRAFLVSFDTNTEVVQDYTDDVGKLTDAVRSLRAGGGTALFDAVYHAAKDKLLNETGGVRRTIVVISDGDDNQSRVSREEALAMAQRAEVTIFAISTNISGVETMGDKVLKRFAEETGGRMFAPFKMTDLTRSFDQISEELRSQYALLFRPSTPRDGRFHDIEVVSLRKGVKLRARKGYYATRE